MKMHGKNSINFNIKNILQRMRDSTSGLVYSCMESITGDSTPVAALDNPSIHID